MTVQNQTLLRPIGQQKERRVKSSNQLTLPKTNKSPLKMGGFQSESPTFKGSIFRGELATSFWGGALCSPPGTDEMKVQNPMDPTPLSR